MDAALVGCHHKDTEGLPAKPPDMLVGSVCNQIGSHLPLEASLTDAAACDWHSAAIDFDHKASAGAIGKFEAEDQIRNKTDIANCPLMLKLHSERERILLTTRFLGEVGD